MEGKTGLSGEDERMEGATTFLGHGWLVAQVQIVGVALWKGLKGSAELSRWGLALAFLQGMQLFLCFSSARLVFLALMFLS